MTYPTLMVHMELGCTNEALLRATHDMAARTGATRVVGIAAYQPMEMYYADGYCGDIVQQNQQEMAEELMVAEAEFRAAMRDSKVAVAWRSTVVYAGIADYLAREARAADLVLTCVESTDLLDATRTANTGTLVMQVGRPVLIVPGTATPPSLEHVMVCWKDTRETRRAIVDALPLLRLAGQVAVVAVVPNDALAEARAALADVTDWLQRHGVQSEAVVQTSTGDDVKALGDIADARRADIIVAGAYGHSRAREWAFGGVTRDLLLGRGRYALVSH